MRVGNWISILFYILVPIAFMVFGFRGVLRIVKTEYLGGTNMMLKNNAIIKSVIIGGYGFLSIFLFFIVIMPYTLDLSVLLQGKTVEEVGCLTEYKRRGNFGSGELTIINSKNEKINFHTGFGMGNHLEKVKNTKVEFVYLPYTKTAEVKVVLNEQCSA